jgi:hypothetical protein
MKKEKSKRRRRRTRSRGRRSTGHKLSRHAVTQKRSKLKNLPTSIRTARVRGLNAISRVRRGDSKTFSHAARLEGTSVTTARRLLPAAFLHLGPGKRIRVKASDPYSARVEIVTDLGPLEVSARGSRERELAGRHRAAVFHVLRGHQPASILKEFRGKKVGGHKLASDIDRISAIAHGGGLDQLDSLYVSPETRG